MTTKFTEQKNETGMRSMGRCGVSQQGWYVRHLQDRPNWVVIDLYLLCRTRSYRSLYFSWSSSQSHWTSVTRSSSLWNCGTSLEPLVYFSAVPFFLLWRHKSLWQWFWMPWMALVHCLSNEDGQRFVFRKVYLWKSKERSDDNIKTVLKKAGHENTDTSGMKDRFIRQTFAFVRMHLGLC
jgi:hypothetical protein